VTATKVKKLASVQPWMVGFDVHWARCGYVHGDGLKLSTADHCYELVPYVAPGQGGAPAGYAIVVDMKRNGFTRVPGSIEQAMAVAELMLTADAMKAEALKLKRNRA
jgi:hypothetical protein